MRMNTGWITADCNERLEFLGDAVLEIVTSDFLFHRISGHAGGRSDKDPCQHCLRAHSGLLCQEISVWASTCSLERERRQPEGGTADSVVSDAMEALIGAIYLDGGFANAKEFIHQIYSE